jgi:hypothetical protein
MTRIPALKSALALAAGLLLMAAAPAQTAAAGERPFVDFPQAAPESVGIDSAKLVELSQWLRRDQLDVRSLLIVCQ